MSSIDRLREPLNKVLDCARQIAENAIAELHSPGQFEDTLGRLRRDLPHLSKQVITAFSGDNRLAADLKHELDCLEEDASQMVDWIKQSSDFIHAFQKARGSQANETQGQVRNETFQEYERRRQVISESCNRVHLTANKVCVAADQAIEKPADASPELSASPARQLLVAIDELVAFVVTHRPSPLKDDEQTRLAELEGRVVGLLAVVADGRIAFENHPPDSSSGSQHYTVNTGVPYLRNASGMRLFGETIWEPKMRSLRATVQSVVDAEATTEPSGQTKKMRGRKARPRKPTGKPRNRKPRTVELLLVLLEDRTKANLNYSELADELKVHVSSVSRAFKHPKYGPELVRRYHSLGARPPRSHQV